MLKKLFTVIASMVLFSAAVYAQPAALMQNRATANGNGASLNVAGAATAVLTVTCTSCAGGTTVNFEGTSDGTNYVGINATQSTGAATGTSTTTAGVTAWGISVSGYRLVRARISAYSAGTITVSGVSVTTGGGGGGSGGGGVISGTVTANIGTTGGLALDATLTGGTGKTQVYYGGGTTPILATDVAGVGGSASGTTSQYMNADTPAKYDASTNGKTTILALSSGKVTYVLGLQVFNSTTSAVTVTIGTGTGTNCGTTFTAIYPAIVLPAPSAAALQGFVLPVALAPYMKTAASENLCLQTSAGVSLQAGFQLTQF